MATKTIKKPRTPKVVKELVIESKKPTDFNRCTHKKNREEQYKCSGSVTKSWFSCFVSQPVCLKCAIKTLGVFDNRYYCRSHYPHRLDCGKHISDYERKCKECGKETCHTCDFPGYNNGKCTPCYDRYTLLQNHQCLTCKLPITEIEEKFSDAGYHIKCIPKSCETCGKEAIKMYNGKRICQDCLSAKYEEMLKKSQTNTTTNTNKI